MRPRAKISSFSRSFRQKLVRVSRLAPLSEIMDPLVSISLFFFLSFFFLLLFLSFFFSSCFLHSLSQSLSCFWTITQRRLRVWVLVVLVTDEVIIREAIPTHYHHHRELTPCRDKPIIIQMPRLSGKLSSLTRV